MGVEDVNENGHCLVDICAEMGLFLMNTVFQHKLMQKYIWERGYERSLIDLFQELASHRQSFAANAALLNSSFVVESILLLDQVSSRPSIAMTPPINY